MWENNNLILDEKLFKQNSIIKINFKILNFEGNYESLKNNYTIISLKNNTVDIPKITIEDNETSGAFKIKIPQVIDSSKNNFHARFSIYLTKNLIVPIEINAKIKENDFGLYYYNEYTGNIQDHTDTEGKILTIYIYKDNSREYQLKKSNLYFRIQCNDSLDEIDKIEHNLIIKVPKFNSLLSFAIPKERYNFKDGITIKIQISISNFQSKKEYDELYNYISTNNFEFVFTCDDIIKKFNLKFVIEKVFEKSNIRYCSIPYFIYENNKFIQLQDNNYNKLSKKNYLYLNYKNFDYKDSNFTKKIRKKKENIKFMSDNIKLIFIIKDFLEEYNIQIWGPYKYYKKIKKFYKSNIETFSDENINKAKEEIEIIYNKIEKIFLKTTYEKLAREDHKNIETIGQFISFLCKESVSKINKINLLNQLSICIDEKPTLKADIEDLKNDANERYLPVIYHNIIFKIGNIFKKRIEDIEKNKGKFIGFLGDILFEKFKKKYNEEEFVSKVKSHYCKKK